MSDSDGMVVAFSRMAKIPVHFEIRAGSGIGGSGLSVLETRFYPLSLARMAKTGDGQIETVLWKQTDQLYHHRTGIYRTGWSGWPCDSYVY